MHSSWMENKNKQLKKEKEFEIRGLLEHLKSLGWNSYQWNYEEGLNEGTKEDILEFKNRFEHLTHFIEIYSSNYNGMLRGDSRISLKEAVIKCVDEAQRFAQCEQTTGHSYIPFKTSNGKEYDNGLLQCKHCGFYGYTNKIKIVEAERNSLKSMLDFRLKSISNMYKSAKTFGFGFNIMGRMLIDKKNEKYQEFYKTKGAEIENKIKEESSIYKSMIEILKSTLIDTYHNQVMDIEFINNIYSDNKAITLNFMIGSNNYNFELIITNLKDDNMIEKINSSSFTEDNKFNYDLFQETINKYINKYNIYVNAFSQEYIENIIYAQYNLLESRKTLKSLPNRYHKFLEF